MAKHSAYIEKTNRVHHPFPKGKKPLLRTLDIELTERCNNNCIHCYINLPIDDLRAKETELSTETIMGIIEEAVSLGCLMVRFTGGEPLLREDFEALYLFSRKLGLRVSIFTNATCITPHIAEMFSAIPPLEKIEVTLYGIKSVSYEAVTRVPGSFEAACKGIDLLRRKMIPFIIKGALLPPNKNEVDAFSEWAIDISRMDHQPNFSMLFDLRCRHDSNSKNRAIRDLRPSPQEVLKVLTRNSEQYLKASREFCSKFIRPPGEKLFTCGAGVGSGCVDAYGMLQPCLPLRHPKVTYNLKNGSLKNGMIGFSRHLRHVTAKNHDYIDRCARCFLKGLCEQCPAKSWMEHGTLDTPISYLCETAHAQARYLGLLKAEEKAWKIANWEERINTFRLTSFS